MRRAAETIVTADGPLTLLPPTRETLLAVGALVDSVGVLEDHGHELMGLLLGTRAKPLIGLRTGYGWYAELALEEARRVQRTVRLLLPHALQKFRQRGFAGAFLPTACVWADGAGHEQVGELLFAHVRAPLARPIPGEPVTAYDEPFGAGASGVFLSFLFDLGEACKAFGLHRKLSDLEPCPHLHEHASWAADLILVDDHFLLIRPGVDPAERFLAEIVRAGITEVESTPSAFLLERPGEGDGAPPGAPPRPAKGR